ncbi:DUF742 domain-containing protein [Glycomyces buryatensis]|uniref:DUF742 domain-containing protein n=1 Tax=Glycomyces buryatensis TaxID=2570927 RepID=A0A4S8QD98_9ACTN|nr:DUF742 domain-containing protein [Glycomyces buryatensis]THV42280.1 DUF742 domain-containing protein [Glycomyces buryatensis]
MADYEERPLLDDDAGPLIRPYMASGGRTTPSASLDLLTLVWGTGRVALSHVEPEHAEVLLLCKDPISVAEISAHMRLPAMVIKVLVSDLLERGAVAALSPDPSADTTNTTVLEALLNGLQRRL